MAAGDAAGYGRYAKPVLAARPDPNGKDIRLRVEGADWQMAEAMTVLRKLTALPKKTGDGSGEVSLPKSWAMVTQVSKLTEEHGYGWKPDPGLNEWIGQEFLRRYDEGLSPDLKFDVKSLSREPMPHQLAGAYVGAMNRRFFFGDEAGLGKTFLSLLTLAELEARGEDPFPAFIVAPASVVDQWAEELDEVFPDWPYAVYRGPKRRNLSSRYKVFISSWDTMRADMKHEADELPPLLKFIIPRTIVLDEGHQLCSKSRQSIAAKKLGRVAQNALILSGTPITRDVGGFWSALQILDIRSFPDEDRFKDRYTDRYRNDYGQDTVNGLSPATLQEFYTLMQGSFRRVAKADVLKDLPVKTYTTRVVQIPPAFRVAYDEMQADMIAHLPDTDEPLEVMSTLAQLTRLTQLASSACDVEITMELDEREKSPTFGEMIPRTHVTMCEPSWKIDELIRVMDDMQGSPLITFSPHTQLVKLAGARAEREGYRVGYITGQESPARKTAYRKAFQAGEIDLLCCNTAAGGVGLNLTAASTMVFLERSFGYWRNSQNEDRIHRKGQTAPKVTIIDIVAANTIESRVRQIMKSRAGELAELVRDKRIVEELLGGQPIEVRLRNKPGVPEVASSSTARRPPCTRCIRGVELAFARCCSQAGQFGCLPVLGVLPEGTDTLRPHLWQTYSSLPVFLLKPA